MSGASNCVEPPDSLEHWSHFEYARPVKSLDVAAAGTEIEDSAADQRLLLIVARLQHYTEVITMYKLARTLRLHA